MNLPTSAWLGRPVPPVRPSAGGNKQFIILMGSVLTAFCAAGQINVSELMQLQTNQVVRRDPALVAPQSPTVVMVDKTLRWAPEAVAMYAGVSPRFPVLARDLKDPRATNARLILVIGPLSVVKTPQSKVVQGKKWSWQDVSVTLSYSVFYRPTPGAPFQCLANLARSVQYSPYSETTTTNPIPASGVRTTTTFDDKYGLPIAQDGGSSSETTMRLDRTPPEQLEFLGTTACIMAVTGNRLQGIERSSLLSRIADTAGSDLMQNPGLGGKIQPLVMVGSADGLGYRVEAVGLKDNRFVCDAQVRNPFPVPLYLMLELGTMLPASAQTPVAGRSPGVAPPGGNRWSRWDSRSLILRAGETGSAQFVVGTSTLGLQTLTREALESGRRQLLSSARIRVASGGLDFRPQKEAPIDQ